jgi:hypothetical protein
MRPGTFSKRPCDEARFTNNGEVNRHYAHYYRQENLRWINSFVETHFQNVFHVNVWRGIIKVLSSLNISIHFSFIALITNLKQIKYRIKGL